MASGLYYFRQLHPLDFLIDPELLKGSLHLYLEASLGIVFWVSTLSSPSSDHHPQLVTKTTLQCQIEWFSLSVENHQQSGPAIYLLQRRESIPFSSRSIGNRNC
ncbi:hypothetical protein M9H77_11690 [Catharanthus roseus]|uniref:Uncharacterized protein n=1 Tax=Catharanthus roseus TaxID=4058 RepID=A0ACC0BF84_CATRO|nr:hypothetical protein M9H77_11690 [Catharanthus roseus]